MKHDWFVWTPPEEDFQAWYMEAARQGKTIGITACRKCGVIKLPPTENTECPGDQSGNISGNGKTGSSRK